MTREFVMAVDDDHADEIAETCMEIVRCKDCVHRGTRRLFGIEYEVCKILDFRILILSSFCSMGVRRGG